MVFSKFKFISSVPSKANIPYFILHLQFPKPDQDRSHSYSPCHVPVANNICGRASSQRGSLCATGVEKASHIANITRLPQMNIQDKTSRDTSFHKVKQPRAKTGLISDTLALMWCWNWFTSCGTVRSFLQDRCVWESIREFLSSVMFCCVFVVRLQENEASGYQERRPADSVFGSATPR